MPRARSAGVRGCPKGFDPEVRGSIEGHDRPPQSRNNESACCCLQGVNLLDSWTWRFCNSSRPVGGQDSNVTGRGFPNKIRGQFLIFRSRCHPAAAMKPAIRRPSYSSLATAYPWEATGFRSLLRRVSRPCVRPSESIVLSRSSSALSMCNRLYSGRPRSSPWEG